MLTNNLKLRADLSFYQILSLGFGFLVLISLLAFNLLPKLMLLGENLFNKVKEICGCSTPLSFTMHPVRFITMIILSLATLTFLSYIVFRSIKLKRATDKYLNIQLSKRKNINSAKLNKIMRNLSFQDRVLEIEEDKPIVFCYGLIKPKICISSGLVKKLPRNELVAVLRHEYYHLSSHEPLKLFIVKLISTVLFFLPNLKVLAQQYAVYSELCADENATDKFQNKIPLTKALSRIMKWEEMLILKNLSISFFSEDSSTVERINKLSNEQYLPKFKSFSFKSLGIIFVLLLSLLYFNKYFTNTSQAKMNDFQGQCQQMQQGKSPACSSMEQGSCALNNASMSQVEHSCI